MFRTVRTLATRTVPYIPKGEWKLPEIKKNVEVEDGVTEKPKAPVNVPKGWRQTPGIPQWKREMFALRELFPDGWDPKRKVSRDDMERIRALKQAQPALTTRDLGNQFRISPEAVRRVLRSKWRPSSQDVSKLDARWARRGERLGAKPVKRRRQLRRPDVSDTIF